MFSMRPRASSSPRPWARIWHARHNVQSRPRPVFGRHKETKFSRPLHEASSVWIALGSNKNPDCKSRWDVHPMRHATSSSQISLSFFLSSLQGTTESFSSFLSSMHVSYRSILSVLIATETSLDEQNLFETNRNADDRFFSKRHSFRFAQERSTYAFVSCCFVRVPLRLQCHAIQANGMERYEKKKRHVDRHDACGADEEKLWTNVHLDGKNKSATEEARCFVRQQERNRRSIRILEERKITSHSTWFMRRKHQGSVKHERDHIESNNPSVGANRKTILQACITHPSIPTRL